jgi:hypothetical protein
MSLSIRIVISPPYCGFPSLSHQLPEVVVVGIVEVVVVAIDVLVVLGAVMVVVVVEVAAGAVVEVVEVVHDASSMESIISPVNVIQITPFFIQTPSLFWQTAGEHIFFPTQDIIC